jgi:uncharacterized repeat protein (TIGR01451 family)
MFRIKGFFRNKEGKTALRTKIVFGLFVFTFFGGNLFLNSPQSQTFTSPLLPAGWNMISLPADPVNPDPAEVFKDVSGIGNGILIRYDNSGLDYQTYYDFDPSPFGPCQRGDGYWLYLYQPTTITYQGYNPTETKTIPLPTLSWYLIGGPASETPIASSNWQVKNNTTSEIKSFADALGVWIQDPMTSWDNGGYINIGKDEGIGDDPILKPWTGYWMYTLTDNLTLIIPPNITLQKSVSPTEPVLPGTTLTYTITYQNTGTTEALNTKIEDPVNTDLLQNIKVQDNGVFDSDTSQITWDIGSLATGESGTVHFTAEVKQ